MVMALIYSNILPSGEYLHSNARLIPVFLNIRAKCITTMKQLIVLYNYWETILRWKQHRYFR